MKVDERVSRAQAYLVALCQVRPNRRTGSRGNREATSFFADTIRPYNYHVDATPFPCLDYRSTLPSLTHHGQSFEVHVSPYSLACDVAAPLVVVSTVEELERADCCGRLLLMRGPICSEQLMPKGFVFYNPEHHQRLVRLLESRQPAAIITATARNPEQVGALDPFPLIVDGDFDIPSVYCREEVGQRLALLQDRSLRLTIEAARLDSTATNVIARLNPGASDKIVLTAHIDAYEDSPGALDDASGTVVLLLVAEMLAGYRGQHTIEIAALNGEDHYSAGGEMHYLQRFGEGLPSVRLAVNVDDIGYCEGGSAYSFYQCPSPLEARAEAAFRRFGGLLRGEQWFQGDHMIFVQSGVPAIAFTSQHMQELMQGVVHTDADTPDLVDCAKLVEVAEAISELVRSL